MGRIEFSDEKSVLGAAFKSHKALWTNAITRENLYYKFFEASPQPYQTLVVIPVMHDGVVHSILRCYSQEVRTGARVPGRACGSGCVGAGDG